MPTLHLGFSCLCSISSASIMPLLACLEAQYAVRKGVPVTPAVDDMQRTWPRSSSTMRGRKAWRVQNCERTFTPKMRSMSP